jgi:hypothetical protein
MSPTADRERLAGQEGKIIALLVKAGERGCTNSELWQVCHAVNSRISDLRGAGYDIEAKPEGGGIWRYRLISSSRPRNSESGGDWYENRYGPRPKEARSNLPLFLEVVR